MYFDLIRKVFVRSGNVAGQGFTCTNDEHLTVAKAPRSFSTLYHVYPSKESPRAKNKRKGHFQSLLQVVAAGFDPKSEHVDTFGKD